MTLLNDENYKDFARLHYDNPICTGMEEFRKDLEDRPKWIKRLLKKYYNGGELRELLILNHIVGFYNTFPGEAGTKLLFYKMEEELYEILKSFVVFLDMTDNHVAIHETITFRSIDMDEGVTKRLEEKQWVHQK